MLKSSQLLVLELNFCDLKNLSVEKQRKIIRQKYLELCLKYHPDKNSQNSQKIQRIISTYHELIASLEETTFQSHGSTRTASINLHIPDTAFDLLLEEGIISAYEALNKERLLIQNDRARAAFEEHYQAFYDLAKAIEKVQSKLAHQRVNYLYLKKHSLKTILTQEWRELIIRLFGEEYLDDFQYRHALATGDLFPILATRKLLSPIKWVITILIGLLQLLYSSATYALEKWQVDQMTTLLRAYQDPNGSWIKVTAEFFEAIAPTVLLFGAYYLVPVPTLLICGLPAMIAWMEIIASPVNKIIRPLSHYTQIPAPIWFAIMTSLTAIAAYGLICLNILPSLTLILPICTLGLDLYFIYAFATATHKIYKINPAASGFMLLSTILSIGMSILFPPEIGTGMIDQISLFFSTMANAVLFYQLNKLLDDPRKAQVQELENLPLPNGPIPESIRTSTLLGYQTATQSARFFNTGIDAKSLTKPEQTFEQKTLSFFGGGKREIRIYHPPYEKNEQTFASKAPLIV